MTGQSTKNSQQVISAAMIYGKGSSDKVLTPYQISVNEAAGKLALENPSLLDQRGILYEKDKEPLRGESCFVFKKGKSRSKSFEEVGPVPSKKQYTSDTFRKEHTAQLLEDIEGKQKQLKYKQLRQSKAQASKDWEMFDRLQKEMATLRKEVFEAQKELKLFQRKEKKSKWYKKRQTKALVSQFRIRPLLTLTGKERTKKGESQSGPCGSKARKLYHYTARQSFHGSCGFRTSKQ